MTSASGNQWQEDEIDSLNVTESAIALLNTTGFGDTAIRGIHKSHLWLDTKRYI